MNDPTDRPGGLRFCPLIAFDEIVGGKYKLRILWELLRGPRRYGQLRRSIVIACQGKPVTPRILSRELKCLQACGLIDRIQYPVVPPRVEYRLTGPGRHLAPVIDQIIEWGMTGAHEAALSLAILDR
jgi:DNA-binding HxlR family transcriptional regulator